MSEKKTESIENLHVEKSSALAWKTMDEVSNRKSSPRLSKIEGSSKTERIQSSYNHFKNFLGKENPDAPYLSSTFFNHKISDPLPINTSQFTLEELQTCLAKMSKQKTSDPDNIPTMLWKDHNFRTELLYFCNETERNKVSVFSKSNIITILRKGDLLQTLNYRSITLTSITSKVYSSLLVNCISKHLEPILRRNQNGFHKGRSTLPQILGLTKIIEEIKIASRKASIVFADFSKPLIVLTRVLCSTFFIFMAYQTKLLQVSKLCMTTQKHLFLVQMERLTLSSQPLVYFKVIHLHHTSS